MDLPKDIIDIMVLPKDIIDIILEYSVDIESCDDRWMIGFGGAVGLKQPVFLNYAHGMSEFHFGTHIFMHQNPEYTHDGQKSHVENYCIIRHNNVDMRDRILNENTITLILFYYLGQFVRLKCIHRYFGITDPNSPVLIENLIYSHCNNIIHETKKQSLNGQETVSRVNYKNPSYGVCTMQWHTGIYDSGFYMVPEVALNIPALSSVFHKKYLYISRNMICKYKSDKPELSDPFRLI